LRITTRTAGIAIPVCLCVLARVALASPDPRAKGPDSSGSSGAAPSPSAAPPASPAPSSAAPSPGAAPSPNPAPAPALSETLTGSAKRDYEAARLLYDDGDFAGALLKFQNAYDASQDARLLWNAAVCAKALRHYAHAVSLVHRYLDSGSPLISPDAADRARSFLAAAEPLTAMLEITANEAGVQVVLDGDDVGVTPLPAPIRVDFGPHQVVGRKAGYKDAVASMGVTDPTAAQLKLSLAPIVRQGIMFVRADPSDTIAVDGRAVGVGLWDGVLPAGAHAVLVSAPGFRSFHTDVLVAEGEPRTVDVHLEALPRAGVPAWAWVLGGAAVAAGAATATYFALRPSDSSNVRAPPPIPGTVATIQGRLP
jgi:hypothetical protein